MTYAQFVAQRLGKKTDYDGVFSYQCVDLIKQYLKDVYATESGIFGGSALAGYESGGPFSNNPTSWKKTPNADGAKPQQGDIIFWGATATNSYGHVAIVDSLVSTTKVKVLEQNGAGGGDGTGANAIRRQDYTLKNALGWYRYRKPLSSSDQATVNAALTANGKLRNMTNDPSLKQLLAQTNALTRSLYL